MRNECEWVRIYYLRPSPSSVQVPGAKFCTSLLCSYCCTPDLNTTAGINYGVVRWATSLNHPTWVDNVAKVSGKAKESLKLPWDKMNGH